MLAVLVIVAIALRLSVLVKGESVSTPPIVGIEMGVAGFHRDVLYTMQFDYPLAGKECEYLLEQPLPAAVYVSVDQLNELQRLRKLNAVYPKFVDTEKTTEKSAPLTVLLKGMPKTTDTLKLPIHFRYHEARADDKTHVQVQIETPTMYLNCAESDSDLIEKDLLQQPNIRFCLDDATRSLVVAPPPTPPKMSMSAAVAEAAAEKDDFEVDKESDEAESDSRPSKTDCNWRQINVEFQLKTPLQADIPVGNSKGYPPVLYVTIVLSWVVSIWTVFHTSPVPRRINQKLEEQRVLQKKMK